ncbi:MAG: GUN4 domain-containing protein [Microcystaceae cyanobacterium]
MIRLVTLKKLVLVLALMLLPMDSTLAQLQPQETLQPTGNSALISPTTGVNYTRLRNLLQAQKWREANDETLNLMLKAAHRDTQGWVTTENIEALSCWDLKTIDSLLKEYSNGRFGFSVQLPIFLSTGNRPGRLVSDDAFQAFGDRIGWRKNGDWITFKGNLTYNLNAPEGHLPFPRSEYQITGGRLEYTTLAKRMLECGLITLPSNEAKPPIQTKP